MATLLFPVLPDLLGQYMERSFWNSRGGSRITSYVDCSPFFTSLLECVCCHCHDAFTSNYLDQLLEKRFEQSGETVRLLYRGQMRGIEHHEMRPFYRSCKGLRHGHRCAVVVAARDCERRHAQ